jgi:hypothetical protein
MIIPGCGNDQVAIAYVHVVARVPENHPTGLAATGGGMRFAAFSGVGAPVAQMSKAHPLRVQRPRCQTEGIVPHPSTGRLISVLVFTNRDPIEAWFR